VSLPRNFYLPSDGYGSDKSNTLEAMEEPLFHQANFIAGPQSLNHRTASID
jgi:hypothetical protein